MLLGVGSGLSVVVLGHISDGTVFHELAGSLLVLLAKTWHLSQSILGTIPAGFGVVVVSDEV